MFPSILAPKWPILVSDVGFISKSLLFYGFLQPFISFGGCVGQGLNQIKGSQVKNPVIRISKEPSNQIQHAYFYPSEQIER